MKKSIFMLNSAIGAMTAAERSKGRYMRGPEGHGADDGGFAEFEAAGEVEVGDGIESNQEAPEKPAKPAKRAPAKPAEKVEEKPAEKVVEDDEGEDDEEVTPKPKPKASERIQELNKRLRQEERLRRAADERLTALEKRFLPGGQGGGNSGAGEVPAPDASDAAKYPLGHLDDRYIEDKLEWLAEKKAGAQADAVLQRQQENEHRQTAERQHADLLEKVDDLSTRGSELFDDFQETVVDAGMKGEWDLGQATFEAAHEAENGAQILYDLSQDKKEATRVSKLSPFGQAKYVVEKDAELSGKSKPRRIPGAGAPPNTTTRGANSSTRINPATDNLDDFEKAWNRDAKKS